MDILDDDCIIIVLLRFLMRLLFLTIPLLSMSCTQLASSFDASTNKNSSSEASTNRYVVMPEQECAAKHSTGTLLRSEVLHPSAKICHYSW